MGPARAVTLLSLLVSATFSWRLAAQCPDGSPPPCSRAVSRAPAPNRVAVLYFDNLSQDTSDAYIAAGLTDEIIARLGQLERLRVKSRMAVTRFRATALDPRTVGRALDVAYLVNGTVRRGAARLRVTVELLRATTGERVWGQQYNRGDDDLLAIEEDIGSSVATAIGGRLATGERATLTSRPTGSPAAYDHYLRGNFFLELRSAEGTARAIGEYREAERLDSGFAAAIGRAAYTYAIARVHHYRLPDTPIESLVVHGLEVAARALRRDSASSDSWMARGYLLAYANPHTMAGSIEAFERAIALDPKNAEAHHQYATILDWLARYDDADREERVALALDPERSITYADLSGSTHFRDTALAVALSDSAVALDPASPHVRVWRVLARLVAGDMRGALDDAELANRLEPGDLMTENALALALAHAGDSTRARALIVHWSGRKAYWLVAAALVAVGDTVAALDRLEHSPPDPETWAMLKRPEFDALHGNPRYERLMSMLRASGAVEP